MRCGVSPNIIPVGAGCKNPGIFRAGCIYEVAWESIALGDGLTDATIKHVPRSGIQFVLGFITDLIQPVQAATGPGAGPLEGQAGYMTALSVNGTDYMPKHSPNSGAGVTSNKYSLASFGRHVQQKAGGVMPELDSGDGTPWGQFGVHRIPLGINDDVTVTIENNTGLAADFGGTYQVLQAQGAEGMSTGSPLAPGEWKDALATAAGSSAQP